MHRAAVGLAILVTGCTSDPTLRVEVDHDPGIVAVVAKTTVSIYDQPGLTCAAIEFGDVPDDQLNGALASEASDGQPLTGIPRSDAKVVVARGYAADGTLVSAGCSELGVVDGDVTITIATVPTATVAVGLNMAEPRGLVVAMTDATNASVDKRAVAWRLFGAAGTGADPARFHNISEGVWEPEHPTCTTGGDATIHPMPPLLPGGYELQLRVSWATKEPPLFSAFTAIDKSTVTVSTITAGKIVAPCAIGKRAGTPTIACLAGSTEVDLYGYTAASRTLAKVDQQTLPTIADSWVGVIAVDGPGGDQDVYAISELGTWQAIGAAPAASAGASWCIQSALSPLRCGTHTSTALQVVPACGDQPAYLLESSTDPGSPVHLRKQPILGGTPTEFDVRDGAIVGAGCVTELQPDGSSKLRQAVVVNVPKAGAIDPFTAVVFACSATKSPCTVPLPSIGQAVAFTDGPGGGEHQLIGTTFDATGAQLARWVFEPAAAKGGTVGNKDRLIERSRQVAAASPRQLVTGQFDADHDADLMWTFANRAELDFQIAYAREVLGAPLSALTAIDTPAGLTPQPVALFATDFNADKFDELVFVFETTVLATVVTTLVVVPTGIPYANPPVATDDPACP